MLIKEKIRRQVSQVVDVLIPEGKWEEYTESLDRENKFTKKNQISIILILCKAVEELQNTVEDLNFQLEQKNSKKTLPRVKEKDYLLSDLDVKKDLDAYMETNPNAKSLYVSKMEWDILVKKMNPALSDTDPEHGYGKAVDPLDGKEKVCLTYRNLPVFKG